jgi:hypothetical protein
MVLEKSYKFDTSNISFSDVKTNQNGGKSVYINLNNSQFVIQTPVMTIPFGLNVYDKGDYPKYSVEISFRDMEENYKIKGFYENMEKLEEMILDYAVKNSMAILGKKKVNREVMEAMYTSILRKSRDKETGELDGKYPTTMKLKLPFWDGKESYTMESFSSEKQVLEIPQEEAFTKNAKIQAIIKCGGIWVVNGKFGCTWSVYKVRVEENKSISNYSFVDDDGSDSDSD